MARGLDWQLPGVVKGAPGKKGPARGANGGIGRLYESAVRGFPPQFLLWRISLDLSIIPAWLLLNTG